MHASRIQLPPVYTRSVTRTLFALWAVFWLLMMMVAVQDYSRGDMERYWEPLLWEGSSAVVATIWLCLQRRIDARYAHALESPARWFGLHLQWFPLVVLTFIPAIYGIRFLVYDWVDVAYEPDPWLFLVIYESIKLLLFAGLWLGIIFGLNTFAQWRAQREGMLQLQKSLADAQLAGLRSQLQPHFLFNALNTISALMHTDVERADRLLARLSELLRSSLQTNEREQHSLDDELRLLKLYAHIMEERFGERVTLSWQIDDAALRASVPVMILQPLLENAFKHGVEGSRGNVSIIVEARRRDSRVSLSIRNSVTHSASHPGLGLGLLNTRERLQVAYAGDASVNLQRDGDAVIASLDIPYRES